MATPWYQQTNEAVIKGQNVDPEKGLSEAEAQDRLAKYGPNQLEKAKKINPFKLFIDQFRDVLVIVLLVSATVSLAISFVGGEKPSYYCEPIAGEAESTQCIPAVGAEGEVASSCSSTYKVENGALRLDDSAATSSFCGAVTTTEGKIPYDSHGKHIENEGPKEALLIYGIVISIAIIGFLNEYKAEKTVEALKKLVGSSARVRRGGKVMDVDATELVPGDIILLEEGQKIPADLRLIDIKNLAVNEASLTGESVPVNKKGDLITKEVSIGDRKNMAFAGTFVTTGTGVGVVVATGSETELGKIAHLVSSVEAEETPMQRKLDDLGKKLGLFIMAICAIVFIIVFFFVKESADKELIQRLIFAFTAAVALAVAAIPEGLAFVVRISLALGARRMAAKKALVRKLSAVEALGSTDVICSDKTGTLTRGEMTVRELWSGKRLAVVSGQGYVPLGNISENGKKLDKIGSLEQLLMVGALCNNANLRDNIVLGDPTEGAMLVAAAKPGLEYEKLRQAWPRVDEIPFSSERKRMSTVHKAPTGGYWTAMKGATEIVLERCDHMLDGKGKVVKLTPELRKEILTQNATMAAKALRVLGFAYKNDKTQPKGEKKIESGLIFAGLQGMMDPPREEVIQVVHQVQTEAGMRVVMITGDYIETAKAVAAEIGLEGEAMSGMDLDKLSQAEFEEHVEQISVYARVNPEHKIRIVQALKKHGHQVAMTGDGVNDAPAIKAADIGIAMGITGTDAAKEAADLILLDDQFLTIIKAIEEGRGIFDNVRKFVNFLISCNIAEVIAVLLGIIFFNNLILTAAQLLFINIVTDGLPAVALGSDPAQRDVLKAKPKHFQQAILTKRVWVEIFTFGTLMSAALIGQYWYNHTRESMFAAVSAAFTAMVVYELVRLVDIRTDYAIKWFSNPWLSVAMASSLVLQIGVLYFGPLARSFNVGPLQAHDWYIMIGCSIALFIIMKLLNPVFDLIGPEHSADTDHAAHKAA